MLGHSLPAIWAAESISNVALTPVYAVAAVLLTLDLIAEKDGHSMSTASIFSSFWGNLVDHDEQGLFLVFRLHPLLRLHQDEHAVDAQRQGAVVAGQRRSATTAFTSTTSSSASSR